MARRVGVPLDMARFDAISRQVPVIANITPSGKYLMEDFFYAGGLRALMGQMQELLDLSCVTVTEMCIRDRIMRDVVHDVAEQLAQRAVANRPMKCRMAHAGADDEFSVGNRDAIERFDTIDIDEMRRPGEPKRHGWHQALAAGQHASVLSGNLGEVGDGLIHGFRRVVAKRRRFHRADFIGWFQLWDWRMLLK